MRKCFNLSIIFMVIYLITSLGLAQQDTLFFLTDNNRGITTTAGLMGIGWGDYDNDGDLDLFISGEGIASNLYRNDVAQDTFVNVSAILGDPSSNTRGVVWADFDGDGDLDLLMTNSGLSLFRNDGAAFTNISAAAGLSTVQAGFNNWQPGVGDYDQDGDLDIVLAGRDATAMSVILLQNVSGVFTDVTATALDSIPALESWGPAFVDMDNDGDLDLWIPTCRSNSYPCRLYWNNGDGTLTLSDPATTGITVQSSYCSALGDFNNDGYVDIYSTGGEGVLTVSSLYQNNGNGTFTDIAAAVHLDTLYTDSRGACFGDIDNDGDLDLLIGRRNNRQRVFRNDGTPGNVKFTEVGDTAITAKMTRVSQRDARTITFADYDNDGDLDIYTKGNGTLGWLLENGGTANHWLGVQPVGASSGIGARVRIVIGTTSQIRDIGCGETVSPGFLRANFGLGAATTVDSVIVQWVSGDVSVVTGVAADQYITVEEPFRIVVDGEKDPFYGSLTGPDDGYLQIRSFCYNDNGRPSNDEDLSAKLWAAWDDTWLYIYEEVKDDTVVMSASNTYQNDVLELKFDCIINNVTNTIFHLGLGALATGTAVDTLAPIVKADKQVARRAVADGYVLEFAVKWEAIERTAAPAESITVAVDSIFGLSIANHDNDGNLPTTREASVQWAANLVDAVWNHPEHLGTVKFLADHKLQFIPTNNISGETNPRPYDGSLLFDIAIDGQKDIFYQLLTGPADGYIQLQWCHGDPTVGHQPVDNYDLSTKIWGAWDSTWFYIYAEVTDDTISLDGASYNYQTDAIEFKIDGIPDSATITNGVTNSCIMTAIDSADADPGDKNLCDNLTSFDDADKQYARGTISNGYTLEFAIRIDSLGGSETIVGAVDEVFGLGINVIDNDGASRQADNIWGAKCNDNIWSTVTSHGRVKFLADNKVQFDATNNLTGETNELAAQYGGSACPHEVGVDDPNANLPLTYNLEQNYPNPFNPITTIAYTIPTAGKVSVVIYNILGQKVATLVDNQLQKAQRHEIHYNASHLATGLYFYSIEYNNKILTKKMLLIK